MSRSTALTVAIATALVLAWMSLGVGVIGADGDPANAMYRRPRRTGDTIPATRHAAALLATAVAQAIAAGIAIFGGLGRPYSGRARTPGPERHFHRDVRRCRDAT